MPRDITGSVVRNLFTLQRLQNGIAAEVDDLIVALFDDIVAQLARIDPTGVAADSFRRRRIDRLIDEIEELTGKTFSEVTRLVRQRAAEVGSLQADFAEGTLRSAVRGVTGVEIATNRTGINLLKSIIDTDPIQGHLLKDWFQGQDRSVPFRVRQQVQLGMAQNETIDDMVRRIRGRQAGFRYRDPHTGAFVPAGTKGAVRERVFRGGVMNTTTREAEAIVRTAVNHISNEAHLRTYRENADVATQVEYVAVLDSRTTFICMGLDGTRWPVDSDEIRRPPQHINCLAGNALVLPRSGVTGASKRWFYGDLVVFKTATGRELTCTPNHPVLTDQGWLPACALDVGGNVICDGGREWERGFLNGDRQQVPSRIEDVTETLLLSGEMYAVPVPTTTKDFHGDGMDGEVAIVGTDRFLRDRGQPARTQHFQQLVLKRRDMALRFLTSDSPLEKFCLSNLTAASSSVSGGGKLRDLALRSSAHAGTLLFASVSDRLPGMAQDGVYRSWRATHFIGDACCSPTRPVHADNLLDGQFRASSVLGNNACFMENSDDHLVCHSEFPRHCGDGRAAAVCDDDRLLVNLRSLPSDLHALGLQPVRNRLNTDAQLAREIIGGATGPVFADKIVHIEVYRDVAAHVYNLETEKGFYAANGIITHNCRSSIVPVIDWAALGVEPPDEGTRASADGQVAASTTYEDWLRDRPDAEQDEILGPARAKLFRAGKLDLRDLVRTDNSIVRVEDLKAA